VTEQVWISIIQWTVSPLLLLIVGAFLNRKIKETRQEITNSHPTHLRDDLDGKFQLVFAKLDTALAEQKNIDKKIDSMSEDQALVFKTLADHEQRLTGQAGKLRRVSNSR
jgi:hypothetical protein